jgi:hypothetical protein
MILVALAQGSRTVQAHAMAGNPVMEEIFVVDREPRMVFPFLTFHLHVDECSDCAKPAVILDAQVKIEGQIIIVQLAPLLNWRLIRT